MADHLQHFYQPRLQKLVLRVLWMPVVFSVDNWVALRWQYAGVYMTVLTGWYEAWVLYSFYTYLEAYLECDAPPGSLAELPVVKETPAHRHMAPCCCARPWRMTDGQFVRFNKAGVLQYTLVQTLCTVITFGTSLGGVWHDGVVDPRYAYMYVTIAVNVSQLIALYCLVYFYYTMHEALAPIHPFLKFMCIKLVIFFSFWQEMLVYALVYFNVIRYQESWTTTTVEDVAAGLQNFLMCVEMLIAALAHSYAFPIEDYKHGSKAERAERPHFVKSVRALASRACVLNGTADARPLPPHSSGSCSPCRTSSPTSPSCSASRTRPAAAATRARPRH